jgi:hypothetical protein
MKRLATYALFTSLTFAACSKKDTAGSAEAPAPIAEKSANYKAGEETKQLVDGKPTDDHRKVIRTGHIDLVVTTYDDARAKLDAMLAAVGGYVDSTQVNHSSGAVSSATLVLRIPHEAFGALLPKLKELGEIASESTSAEDITDQYVDIAARLASSKTLEKRLLELAADKTSGVEALLAVERELARVRGEIESYEGRMRQWNDQIAMSTLTLSLSTKAPAIAAAPQASLGSRISQGFHDSIGALQDFGAWFAISATSLLPWMILIIPGFLFGRRAYRRLGKSLPAATVVQPPPAQ